MLDAAAADSPTRGARLPEPGRRVHPRPTSAIRRGPQPRSPGSTRSVIRRRWSGSGLDFADAPDYVRHNDLGTAVLLRELAGAAIRRAAGAGQQHGRLRRGSLPLRRRTASDARARARPRTSTPGASSHAARAAARRWRRRRSTRRRAWIRATSTPRPSCTRSISALAFARETGATVIALRYHNVYGPRMPRDTPYAGVASIFASSLAAGRRAAGVRGRRPAARLRPCPRRRPRQRARAVGARRGRRRLQRRQRHSRARCSRWPQRWRPRTATTRRGRW